MIYLNRDNEVRFRLKQNKKDVVENSITRVTIWLPSAASASTDSPIIFDTDVDSELLLENDKKDLVISLGQADLNPGTYLCYITVFDPDHPNGIAWARESLRVDTWV